MERKRPSGFIFNTSSAEVFQGTTVTLQPLAFKERMIFSLMPQSTATTLKLGLGVREYQRFLQLTLATPSRLRAVAARMLMASSSGVSAEVIMALRLPMSRMERASFLVSTP